MLGIKFPLKLNYEADFLQQSLHLLQASADRKQKYLHELPLYLNFHFLVPEYRCCWLEVNIVLSRRNPYVNGYGYSSY